MQHQIKFGSRTVVFNLEYKKRRSLSIKVHPDFRVEVIAPFEAKEAKVFQQIKRKAPWILKQIDYFNTYKPSTPSRRFINGETHLYLGRQYRLKIVLDKEVAVKVYRGKLWMYAPHTNPEALRSHLDQWYKQKALIIFNELLTQILPKFRRYKIKITAFSIRTIKRWGSCTPSGKINLNPELVKAPKGSIEYVIVHELCHLIHHNHTNAFRNLLFRMLPDWYKWKERLEYTLA
jgi:predicted metal-dependent hydrolase